MSEALETLTSPCGRYVGRIFPDTDPLNPRLEYDNVCTMLCWHRRYNLGDPSPSYERNVKLRARGSWNWPDAYRNRDFLEGKPVAFDGCTSPDVSYLGPGIVLPLYLYDHSGLTIRLAPFNCPWDSGQVGWIHCSYEKANKELLAKPVLKPRRSRRLREKMFDCIEAEVETYDQYLRGDVYGYEIVPEEESKPGDPSSYDPHVIDSYWGFFGHGYVVQEVKSVLANLSKS